VKNPKCFAIDGKECTALTGGKCYGKCSFYKSGEEHEKSYAAAFRRIAGLPFHQQRYIAEHYYDGFYPWVSGARA
jgi:hypothetical protein